MHLWLPRELAYIPSPGNVQGQAGQGFEQFVLAGDVLLHCGGQE